MINCRYYGSVEAPKYVLVQVSARHELPFLEEEAGLLPSSCVLVAVELDDWIADLMPWPDTNITKGPVRGQETLSYILSELVPSLRARYGPLPLILGGYSLGGLFALWASAQTDCFKAIAAVSPSVWIRDWLPFSEMHRPLAEAVYLSLGDQEEHVKNQAIARVGNVLRAQYVLLKDAVPCTLVWEKGGHFADNAGRLARAFNWTVARLP